VEYQSRDRQMVSIHDLEEARQRLLMRTDWGMVHQNPRDGLRMNVSGGANIGERLMATGSRYYSQIREEARSWLEQVEVDISRMDHKPATYSGGMQQSAADRSQPGDPSPPGLHG
jgi:putative phosphonate transport system ATP-binding protein